MEVQLVGDLDKSISRNPIPMPKLILGVKHGIVVHDN